MVRLQKQLPGEQRRQAAKRERGERFKVVAGYRLGVIGCRFYTFHLPGEYRRQAAKSERGERRVRGVPRPSRERRGAGAGKSEVRRVRALSELMMQTIDDDRGRFCV